MKKIAEKLLSIGKELGGKISKALKNQGAKAADIFSTIRLFTRGKHESAVEAKRKLSKKMHGIVSKMLVAVQGQLKQLPKRIRDQAQSKTELYNRMLKQIIQWVKTGKHPAGKLISLWNLEARAITRNKAAKATEFGRRWIITRLLGGYVIGNPCQKLGGDADVKIADEVVMNFLNTTGEVPRNFTYDRGGDGEKNYELLGGIGVENICIFPKGSGKKMTVSPAVFNAAKRERALSEASIATIKHNRYGFNKPRARSSQSCITKGQMAMFGFNINHLFMDLSRAGMAQLEIT